MTTRQQKRLELAERVCRLAMRHHSCGLIESEGYRPDVVVALRVMQGVAEREGDLASGSLSWLGRHAAALQAALFAWMEAVGIDPASHDKAESKRVAMELAQEALGPDYEASIEQLPEAKRVWIEKTADDRAASIAQGYCSGKIHGFDELRMAIAAEILEAEHVARDPFVEIVREMWDLTKTKSGDAEAEKALTNAFAKMMSAAWRWLGVVPKEKPEEEAANV